MDILPAEVLHLICKALTTAQAAAARLINKRFAYVAAFYVVDSITVYTSFASFNRLRSLADHPVFHQTIRTVVYRSNLMIEFEDRAAYIRFHRTPEDGFYTYPYPTTARAQRLHERNKKKGDARIAKQYLSYLDRLQEQKLLLSDDMMLVQVGQQVAKFTRLECIIFAPQRACIHHSHTRFAQEFARDATPIDMASKASDVQVPSLLLPAGRVIHSLRDITLHAVNVTVFEDPKIQDSMIAAFTRLKSVDIELMFSHDDVHDAMTSPDIAHERLFGSGGLRRTLAAAKHLTKLKIAVSQDGEHDYPLDATRYVLSDTVWPDLTQLYLRNVTLHPDKYISCLRRQPKLVEIGWDCLRLEIGSWIEIIDEVRNLGKMTTVQAVNYLLDDINCWCLDYLDEVMYTDGLEIDLGAAIDMYICFPDLDSDEDADFGGPPNPLTCYDDLFKDIDELASMYGGLSDAEHEGHLMDIDEDPELVLDYEDASADESLADSDVSEFDE